MDNGQKLPGKSEYDKWASVETGRPLAQNA